MRGLPAAGQSFDDQIDQAGDELLGHTGGRHPPKSQSQTFRGCGGLNIQIPEHLHVVGDETYRYHDHRPPAMSR